MTSTPRHQCLIYEGSPSRHLAALASVVAHKLKENNRCLCLNSPVMIAGMRCYLAAVGVDVHQEVANGRLVLSSSQHHLANGRFDVDLMMGTLEDALLLALREGYHGLWATGDMSWELGPQNDFSKLLEYECRLENFFHQHALIGGVCQYHADTLPRDVLRIGLLAHPAVFVNETLSHINLHFHPTDSYSGAVDAELDSAVTQLCRSEGAN
jgi:hypothetical protein